MTGFTAPVGSSYITNWVNGVSTSQNSSAVSDFFEPVGNNRDHNDWTQTASTTTEGVDVDNLEGETSESTLGTDAHPSRHHQFYMRSNMVEIRVEDVLFRIPSNLLTGFSEDFDWFFKPKNGQELTTRWVLTGDSGVTADAFASLVHVLSTPIFCEAPNLSVSEWSSVLELATLWNFAGVRLMAINRLSNIATPFDKIMLARPCKVYAWLMDGYLALCGRPQALSLDEARRLPLEDVVRINEARQAGFRLAKPLEPHMDRSQNHAFHQLFPFHEIPIEESLITAYVCGLDGISKLCGTLYVTRKNLCFHENLAGFITHVVIPIRDLISIEKRNQNLIVPLAVGLKTKSHQYLLVSLVARDASFDVLYGVWLEHRINASLESIA